MAKKKKTAKKKAIAKKSNHKKAVAKKTANKTTKKKTTKKKTANKKAPKKKTPSQSAVKGKSVTWYIGKLESWQQEIVSEVDSLLVSTAPKSTSSIKWAQPVYESNGPYAFMRAAKKHVTLGFWRGAELDDPKRLFEGDGDKMRHIKIKGKEDIPRAVVKKWIKQAIKLNGEMGDPSMSKSSSSKKATKKKVAKKATKKSTQASKRRTGSGTADKPWKLKTPPGKSEFTAWRDEAADPPALVVQVGKTQLRYHLRCIDDLHAMLKKHGDWILLGSADEQKPAKPNTVEAWGRSKKNPVRGWYGLKRGFRGRFGNYIPPVLKHLGLAEVEDGARNNRMRAI